MWKTRLKERQKVSMADSQSEMVERMGETASRGTGGGFRKIGVLV
jgi:hypothetical protein